MFNYEHGFQTNEKSLTRKKWWEMKMYLRKYWIIDHGQQIPVWSRLSAYELLYIHQNKGAHFTAWHGEEADFEAERWKSGKLYGALPYIFQWFFWVPFNKSPHPTFNYKNEALCLEATTDYWILSAKSYKPGVKNICGHYEL